MKITPEYIRAKQEENKDSVSMLVDTMLEDVINEFISSGHVLIPISKIREHGIGVGDVKGELMARGFLVKQCDDQFYEGYEGSSIKIALPPQSSEVMKPQNEYFGKWLHNL